MILDWKVKDCKSVLVDCRYNSMKALLDYYKYDLNVFEIFLLGRAFTFKYAKINLKNEGIYGLPLVTVSDDDIEYSIFDSLKIPYHTDKMDESPESWRRIKEIIDDDRPIIFKLDERILRNNEAALNEHIKIRFLSIPVMYGYDEDNVHLFWSWATNSENLLIDFPLDRFNKYRNTICLPNSPEYRCCYVDEGFDGACDENTDDIINESIKKIVTNMLSGECKSSVIGTMDSSEVMSGIRAMKCFADDLKVYYEKLKNNEEYRKFLVLSVLLLRNTLLNGSKTAYRIEFANALNSFGRKTDNEALLSAGNEMAASAKRWQEMLAFMGKLARNKTDFENGFASLIEIYQDIYIKEKEIYEALGEAYGIKCV
ncbi:BtrH N-terminal domain-containing protein [Ruminococcus flavefaciens]|uniref:BtrH N-terminal domain-containing protein n=1 Tax=Ruminococcus flavefaciens TaxID=1265 RepID=UPI000A9411C4|nr:BtrH N-terminal domain-containing protein [Ruminococcus flavefaciens]